MKNKTPLFCLKALAAITLSSASLYSHSQMIVPGGSGWADSYAVDGKCYCDSTYDHGIGSYTVETPAGTKTVVEVCEAIGPGPGRDSNTPVYNTVQCGHDPAHTDKGNFLYTDGVRRYVADEVECPGRVDLGPEDCSEVGPMWDLSVFDTGNGDVAFNIPGRVEAEDHTSQGGTVTQGTSDVGGGQAIGHTSPGDHLSYLADVETSGTYLFQFRVASPRSNVEMELSVNGSVVDQIDVPNTSGWEEWTTISHPVNLSAGEQTIRIEFDGNNNGLMNLNWITASLGSDSERELDSTNWSLSSSTNSGDVYNAIDGDSGTRWTTWRQTQRSGQTFTVDFNETLTFDRIVLDSSNSPNDQPRGYEIHVSSNGSSWGSSVASGAGDSDGVTTIDFADQNARFVRITQTGSASFNWWSIHELTIFANSND